MYAGLTWQEYWASEGVYEAGNVQFSEAEDSTGCNHKHLNTMEQKKRTR
ncbi:penicillin-binding Tp47 domain A-containing protein [Eubacterium sp.]